MRTARRPPAVLALVALSLIVGTGAAVAQVEEAHLRIDGMT